MAKVLPYKWLSYFFAGYDYKYDYYCKTSAYDFIKQIFKGEEELISVLLGQFGDYGAAPKKASFFLHANIVNHYIEGGWFPSGGTGVIANEICKTIKSCGGNVLVGKSARKVIELNYSYEKEMKKVNEIYKRFK